MDMTNAEYNEYIKRKQPKSPMGTNMLKAFVVGGLICTVGQGLMNFYMTHGLGKDDAGTAVSLTLVFLGALLTGLGIYDDIAKFGGAGTLVPITGFANSVVAPALEFKREGLILGTCAKMFAISGPVIVYGIGSSVLYGFLLLLFHMA